MPAWRKWGPNCRPDRRCRPRLARSGEDRYVAGELDSGTAFACWVDGGGRVLTDLEAGGYGASYEMPAPDLEGELFHGAESR